MREELDALIGVACGCSRPRRKGYRHGSYTRDQVTTTGRVEDLQVPRDRKGQFHTQVFERFCRYELQEAEALTRMCVAGTSTHKGPGGGKQSSCTHQNVGEEPAVRVVE
jgi:putative transposase